jgi:hypothetical protein
MLVEDLLRKVSFSFSVKRVILTGTIKRAEIKYVLDEAEKTEHLNGIERRSWILDYFFTKTACEIDGFIPVVRPIAPGSTCKVGTPGSVSSSESRSSGKAASRETCLPIDSMTDATCRVLPHE